MRAGRGNCTLRVSIDEVTGKARHGKVEGKVEGKVSKSRRGRRVAIANRDSHRNWTCIVICMCIH